MFGLLTGFEGGVGGKGIARFFNFDGTGKIGQRDWFEAGGLEQFAQFDALLAIVGAEDELHEETQKAEGRKQNLD